MNVLEILAAGKNDILSGAGNNPMVGMTVSVAVSVEEAATAGKF